jgi:hypothetical protein
MHCFHINLVIMDHLVAEPLNLHSSLLIMVIIIIDIKGDKLKEWMPMRGVLS